MYYVTTCTTSSQLSLSDATLKEFYDSVLEDANTKAKKANIVSLLDKTDEEREKEANVEKEKEVRVLCTLSYVAINP